MHSTGITFITPLAVLFVVVPLTCLFVGVIYAVIRVGKRYGALAAIGLALALTSVPLGIVSMLFYARLNNMNTVAEALQEQAERVESSVQQANSVRVVPIPNSPPSNWESAIEFVEFQASLYPGIVECAEPLAQQISEVVRQKDFATGLDQASDGEGVDFYLRIEDDFSSHNDANSFFSSFMKSLQKNFPRSELRLASIVRGRPMKLKRDQINLTFSMQVESNDISPWDINRRAATGNVVCQISTDSNSTDAVLRFADKPWVNRFDEVVSGLPNRQFVVGYSDKLASSESVARELAMKNAQAQVRIAAGNGVNTLIDDSMVIDRFAQKLSRPYGDVWREAVLVDITDEAMLGLVEFAAQGQRNQSIFRIGTTLTAVLFVLATVVICFLANMLTQGYYRKPIKVSGTGVAIAAIIFSFVLVIFIG